MSRIVKKNWCDTFREKTAQSSGAVHSALVVCSARQVMTI